MPAISLYIHIPFCVKKCAYCDFVSFAGREDAYEKYMLSVENELKRCNAKYGKIDLETVFIGGGTPSVLPSDAVMRLMAMSRRFFHISETAEITVEANPGTVDIKKLRDYRDCGVNRLSIGMQSSSERLLRLIGRVHSHEQTVRAVEAARAAGFKNINLDLIYALPTQTMSEWIDTLKAALALNPAHLSLYNLIIEENTPIAKRVCDGELAEQTDDAAIEMRAAAGRILAKRGYGRYEISNYAKPGFECRHNTVYWTRGEYLGIGCAAHSFMGGDRFANTPILDDYLNGVTEVNRETVAEEGAREEAIMLGTRMTKGISMSLLANRQKEIDELARLGLVKTENSRLKLTDKGMDVQNAVVMKLI